MATAFIELPARYYLISRLYGPGMPASGAEGSHDCTISSPVGRVGLVLVHCWNLGEADGPYPIGPDAHCPGEPADWVPTAHEIVRDRIAPVLAAAREAEMPVFHVAQNTYAPRYESYEQIAADPDLKGPAAAPVKGCVRPMSVKEIWAKEYGGEFPGPVWVTHKELFDIAEALRPIDDEPVLIDGYQLNGLCRRRDIDTLIYAGFMADLCLVNIAGGIREMANKFQYRCIALRDCTTAYEYADTVDEQIMNRAVMRHIETDLGYTADGADLIEALGAARS